MSVINVEEWAVDQVADWISGLDTALAPYAQNFVSKKIDGRRLLNFMAGDLVTLGVEKVGDQVLLADAIQSLRNELESDRVTLQTLASNVAVRSKTYRSELTASRAKKNFISNESLASASYLLDGGKTLLRWLTRFPFLGVPDYDEITKRLTKHLFELAMLSQRDSFADNAIEEVQYLCTKIIEICDHIINAKDSLTIQPAAVDVITIRKRHEQELGLQFESSYFGLHMVSGVNLSSPAHQSGHLERGDEILQVNYQTVVGWNQAAVVNLLYENPCEVILTIKRRPRHASNSLGHMYLRPSKLPGRNKSKLSVTANPILEVEDDDEVVSPEARQKSPPSTDTTEGTDTTTSTYSAAETRFWKLYPKPRNLLRRRATVTGASPTSTRPPVTFTNDESIQPQHPTGSTSRHKLDKCISAPERNKLEKQDQVDESLRLFVGDLNVRGSRITLPFIGATVAPPAGVTLSPPTISVNSSSSNLGLGHGKSSSPEKVKEKELVASMLTRQKLRLEDKPREDSLDDVFEAEVLEAPPPPLPAKNPISSDKRTNLKPKSKPLPPEPVKVDKPDKSDPEVVRQMPPEITSRRDEKSSAKVGKGATTTIGVQDSENISTVKVGDVLQKSPTEVEPGFIPVVPISAPVAVPVSTPAPALPSRFHAHNQSPLIVSMSKTQPHELRKVSPDMPLKPQSLTNLTAISNMDEESDGKHLTRGSAPCVVPVYSGFLHQRQPHWKFGGPRWSRCRAAVDSQFFRLLKPQLEIQISSSYVTLASEVHSRPFAFKIEDKKDKSSVHYFAAESQAELNIWLGYLGVGDELVCSSSGGGRSARGGIGVLNRSMSVQPDVSRTLSSSPSSTLDKQRRLSLPHSQLQNQFRRRLTKMQSTTCPPSSSYGASYGNVTSASNPSIHMEDKLRFWNSSPSPTHKSNISSITITSCKRNLQQQESLKKKHYENILPQRANVNANSNGKINEAHSNHINAIPSSPPGSTAVAGAVVATIAADGTGCHQPPTTATSPTSTTTTLTSPNSTRVPLNKKSSLDSPTKKCRMGVTMLLRRKGSDSVNNNDVCCTCGRSYSSTDKGTQTEELVLIFSGGGVDGESRI